MIFLVIFTPKSICIQEVEIQKTEFSDDGVPDLLEIHKVGDERKLPKFGELEETFRTLAVKCPTTLGALLVEVNYLGYLYRNCPGKGDNFLGVITSPGEFYSKLHEIEDREGLNACQVKKGFGTLLCELSDGSTLKTCWVW